MDKFKEEASKMTDYETSNGGLITNTARIDYDKRLNFSVLKDPNKPDDFWFKPGFFEGIAVPDNRVDEEKKH